MTICKKHETEEVRFYCEECKELICDDCVVGDHSVCLKTKIGEYEQRQKRSLQETTKSASETGVPNINRILERITIAKQSFNCSVDKEVESISSKTEIIIKIFNELKEELVKTFEDLKRYELYMVKMLLTGIWNLETFVIQPEPVFSLEHSKSIEVNFGAEALIHCDISNCPEKCETYWKN
ncbi:unnamed protein product [Mytilus edulis]|uniref:B box-type domain-containing protein n=1 Tax=Mytilus edulis TaxID=6550 RepID=A0A8S3R0N6_MYTED|nr:unnamed protein product [Mytilus edulis]